MNETILEQIWRKETDNFQRVNDTNGDGLDEEVLKEDREVVEDLMLVAVNQAINNISKKIENTMDAATGGMLGKTNFPGI